MRIGGTIAYLSGKIGVIAGQSIAAAGITSTSVGGTISGVGVTVGSGALVKAGAVIASTALGPVGWAILGGAVVTGSLLGATKIMRE